MSPVADASLRLGEVVEAGTTGFTAQCDRLGEPPALGNLVVTSDGETELYGVVCGAATSGIDPSRRVMALGRDAQDEAAIYQAHPELTQLLRTDFQALVVGYRRDGVVRQHLPPRPARVHAFVRQASKEQVAEFTRSLDFLRLLIVASVPARDDALAACLRSASAAHPDPRAFLVRAGKALAGLLALDGQRLSAVLRLLRS